MRVQKNNREHRLEHSSLRRDSRFDLGEIWHQMSCCGRPMMSSGIERSRFAQKPGTRQIAHGSHAETGNICFINVKKHPVQVDLNVDDCTGRRQWSNTHLKPDWDWPVVSSPTAQSLNGSLDNPLITDFPTKLPSGNLTVCYWKWPFIVDFPIKNCDFP